MDQREFYKALGEKISASRKAKTLTQLQLAERAGLSRATLASIESGRQSVDIHTLLEIVNSIGVTSIEAILPATAWISDHTAISDDLVTTGSKLSAKQRREIAGIVSLIGE